MDSRLTAMWFAVALGAGCAGDDLEAARPPALAEQAQFFDDAVAQEAARMAIASGGQFELGRAFAQVDAPAADETLMLDRELVRRKLNFDAGYRERVSAVFGSEKRSYTPRAVIGIDNRILVDQPRTYPYSKHVYIIMQRPHTELDHRRALAYVCSGTFLDEDFVLTAAHCIYNRAEGHFAFANDPVDEQPPTLVTQWGNDFGRGFACLGDDIDSSGEFATNCEFVQARWVPSSWSSNVGSDVDADFAVIKLERANHPNGLGDGAWMAMSSIDTAAGYDAKMAVFNGFPTDGPDGANFVQQLVSVTDPTITTVAWQTANWAFYTPAHLYHRSGAIDSTTTLEHLAYLADSSGGDSGAGVFYYSDGSTEYSGQSHFLIGVHHGGLNGDGFNVGATVHQFRDWVTGIMAAN